MFLNLEKKYVNLPNGERYAYIEKGEGDKVVLLIHGNNASSIHYEPLYREFPEGYRVVAPDLRGFGDSSYNKSFAFRSHRKPPLKALWIFERIRRKNEREKQNSLSLLPR